MDNGEFSASNKPQLLMKIKCQCSPQSGFQRSEKSFGMLSDTIFYQYPLVETLVVHLVRRVVQHPLSVHGAA